jgi:hypothetical protein
MEQESSTFVQSKKSVPVSDEGIHCHCQPFSAVTTKKCNSERLPGELSNCRQRLQRLPRNNTKAVLTIGDVFRREADNRLTNRLAHNRTRGFRPHNLGDFPHNCFIDLLC